MTTAQAIWAALIAAQAVVNLPFLFALLKGNPMIDPAFQAVADEITAAIKQIPSAVAAEVAAAESAATAAAAQNAADNLAVVKAAADALTAAVAPPAAPAS